MKATAPVSKREVHIVGGGTFSHVRKHLSLAAPAFGSTAQRLAELFASFATSLDTHVHLTKMADPNSNIVTNDDLRQLARQLVLSYNTKIVIWTPAVVDFDGDVYQQTGKPAKDAFDWTGMPLQGYDHVKEDVLRLQSDGRYALRLTPVDKIVGMYRRDPVDGRQPRKDIFLVAFKSTAGATEEEMYTAGLKLCKNVSANLVLVNDTVRRLNMVVTPEEAYYHLTHDRDEALRGLAEMAYLRSQLTFTRSTVIAGDPVAWDDPRVYESLRTVVNHCIEAGAYKPFLGVTAGHFAAKIADNVFLTSRRKTNFNNLPSTGLVQVTTDGPEEVTAMGGKPSVVGQSQRIVFEEHPELDSIVHFHCPIRPGSPVPVVSQREYECGSHECGQNTSNGLRSFTLPSGNSLDAVMLDQHGPNIVFNHETDPQEVIDFIEANFDLTAKTGGYTPAMANA